jgi:hypothetical protein
MPALSALANQMLVSEGIKKYIGPKGLPEERLNNNNNFKDRRQLTAGRDLVKKSLCRA